ncbi:MAG: helicase-exonuclease AddAB subunit AddA [Defluviitaleaceae bacterium]|nr:helicase-exonuclease AddAB subunit AddA [Defluviitaleaceae bacterium]
MEHFTPAQKEAIMCNAPEILVSAAAGSGKTAVLTERIIRHISEGADISELLVVTFTEAASAEMRDRITARLAEKSLFSSEADSRQANLLPTADISTIHAFCRKLIKEHFQMVDIDPAFRVGDDAELEIVSRQVMDELFEAEYSREGNEDFLDLVDVYGGKTTDGRLDTLVRGIYNFMESEPFPEEAAKRYAAVFEDVNNLDDTAWAKIAREEIVMGLEGAIEGLRRAAEICAAPGGPIKYEEKILSEREMLLDLLEKTLKGTAFAEMYACFNAVAWGRLPAITAKDEVEPVLKSRVQRIRDKAVKERIKSLVKGVFFAPPEKMTEDINALKPRVAALMRLATRFSEAYAAEKRARNTLDFSDLEHFAIKILYPGGPADMTPAFPEKKYFEVLVDEYQDSNEIQDLILSAVAERRFMVGDVKQSIYRFRRADPGIFLKKYEMFENSEVRQNPLENLQKTSSKKRIDLSHNFRSRPEVLGAVNFFFSQLMCREVGDVNYDDNAALFPGREEYPQGAKDPRMMVEILDQSDEDIDEDFDNFDSEPPGNTIAETRMLANCINELISSRKYKPDDIVILTRSLSRIAGEVIEELKNHGIDAIADMSEGFFEQQEIKTALAFLRVTDNPRQDIDLITALSSPVYAFNADELFEVASQPIFSDDLQPLPTIQQRAGDFYEKLLVYAKNSDTNKKAHRFLSDLEKWRNAAVYMPVSRLVGLIYDSTAYPAHVANLPGGAIRQANLRLLIERAIEFEDTSLKGLFHFIRYIEKLSAAGNIAGASEPDSSGTGKVRLMTIHKSKGLEFPVVICALLAKKFNTDDERRPVILHPQQGAGPFYINTELRTRSNTLARFSLSRLTRRENLSEELRCLYVAMTRAKDLLILTARVKNFEDYTESRTDHLGDETSPLPVYYRRGVSGFFDWLMPCLLRRPKEAAALFSIRTHNSKQFSSPPSSPPNIIFSADSNQGEDCEKSIKGFSLYTSKPLKSLPSKLSISEIKRLYDITPDSSFSSNVEPSFEPPDFINAENAMTAKRMGSVLHKVMEFIDYRKHTGLQEIEELLKDLTEKNLLTPEEALATDCKKIKNLVQSPLGERLRIAAENSKLFRETPFVLTLPAGEIYPDTERKDEKILVHGIIDCFFEENGKIILLDFKSDNIPKSVALKKWAEKHRVQMDIYKLALEKSTDSAVEETLIYAFSRDEVFKY